MSQTVNKMGSNSAKQTVAIVKEQGQPAEFVHDYPVGSPGHNEVLAKVLYSGVCQSGRLKPPLAISYTPIARDQEI